MIIKVCIGSSCHKRKSYDIIKRLRNLIKQHNLTEDIDVVSAFCLGHCKDGVTIKIDNQIITGVSVDNIDAVFKEYILKF